MNYATWGDEDLVSELATAAEDPKRWRLSDWEQGFVSSILEWFEEHGELTDGQRDKAIEILEAKL